MHVKVLQLRMDKYKLFTGIPLHVPRHTIIVTLHVAVIQLLFDQFILGTGNPLYIPRYKFKVTMHAAVLQLMFDQYTLCNNIPLHFSRHNYYHSTFGINTINVRSIQNMYRNSPLYPTK